MNLFDPLPTDPDAEVITTLLETPNVRIVRIVSTGQTTPEGTWYDQDEDEWVVVLRGRGTVAFEDGTAVAMTSGDTLHIPAHRRHRVIFTDPDEPTVWLAVHVDVS